MHLLQEVKSYIRENKNYIFIFYFVLILAYGYFIVNWSLSTDSEEFSFLKSNYHETIWFGLGRFLIYFLYLFTNNKIIPFWNDFISVHLIFLSTIIWAANLWQVNRDKLSLFIFSTIYCISPIYTFYLRFTTYNIAVSIGLVFASLAVYYLSKIKNLPKKLNKDSSPFWLSLLYLFLAISIYQMFAAYWLTGFLLIGTYTGLVLDKQNPNFNLVNYLFYRFMLSIALLIFALILYKLALLVISYFIPPVNYVEGLMWWGKYSPSFIKKILYTYFKRQILRYPFNYFCTYTIIFNLIFFVYILIFDIKKYLLIYLLIALTLSAFSLPLITGDPLPLRTLLNIPLMLAGTWLIIYIYFNKLIIRKLIITLVIIGTFFNAQYIVRLFYGDNLRFFYDMNYANQIYNFLLTNLGEQIKYKPLVIIGKHNHKPSPLILQSDYDIVGHSLFRWNKRIHNTMRWLGYNYVLPTAEQEKIATDLSYTMPSFPSKNSLLETENFNVLKLSSMPIDTNQQPITIDMKKYRPVNPSEIVSSNLNIRLDDQRHTLALAGWAYFRKKYSGDTSIFLRFKSNTNQYLFPANVGPTPPNVVDGVKEGVDTSYIGYSLILSKSVFKSDIYQVSVILVNNGDMGEINLQKSVAIKNDA
ncbi:glucosyltransferase domain-containing protein [Legionella sp. D16C41]|uniref:glucosyltransferase domain-containing protein n=1 Tax=Legionella sp. D16C41 TaxID=3402688 RepID=UPI003AF60EF3